MRALTFRMRLGVWAVLMLALPLVIFGCVVAVSVYYDEVEATERELRVESASVLGRMLDARRTGREPEEVRALIEPFHPYLEVLDESGKPVYRSAALAGLPGITDPRESGNVRTLALGDTVVQQATASADGLTVSLGASLARPRARLRQLLRGYAVAAPFLLAAFAADDVRLLGEPLQLCIQSDLPPGIMVRADAARLRQVLLNLVDNAVTFNRRDGRLHLALALGENDVRLTVGNTGPGLSAEHRARIFERFFRGDAARSREVAGFGLGLSISREIILAHSGHLDLARCEPDWTEFRAVLPRARVVEETVR